MSLQLPKCDLCKHHYENVKSEMCCDAFPEGIPPEKITWGDEDAECANGIKYEDEEEGRKEFIPDPDSILVKMYRI